MLNKLRWYLQKFMVGRNGRDELQTASLFAAIMFSVISSFMTKIFHVRVFDTLTLLFLGYSIFRLISKDVYKRREENQRFLQEIEFLKLRISVRKTHKIYKCKGCGRKIRVPKGKGRIEITCPLCGKKFRKRT